MASSNNMIAVSSLLMIVLFGGAMAKNLHVNWGADADVHFAAWASNTTIVQGDRLFFDFHPDPDNIDVLQVPEESFRNCKYVPGRVPLGHFVGDRGILLSDSGTYYFINDFPGKCENGWKLQINVLTKEEVAAGPPQPPPTPTAPFFPVTPTPDSPFFPRSPPPPFRSGGAPSTLVSLSTLTFPFCIFFCLFSH